jgi:hypothetical protein
MAKILNVDELAPVEKKISIKGVEYDVVERTVEQVIQAVKAEKELAKDGNGEERMNLFIRMIGAAIPDLPESTIRNLPVRSLMVIMDFVNNNEEVEAEDAGK